MEAAEHLDDVGMVEKHLDFNLTYKLVSDLLLVQQLLLYDLQGTDKARALLSNKVHSSVLPRSQLLDLVEVLHPHLPHPLRHRKRRHCVSGGVGIDAQTTLHVTAVDPVEEGRLVAGEGGVPPLLHPAVIFGFHEVDIFKRFLLGLLLLSKYVRWRGQVLNSLTHAIGPSSPNPPHHSRFLTGLLLRRLSGLAHADD